VIGEADFHPQEVTAGQGGVHIVSGQEPEGQPDLQRGRVTIGGQPSRRAQNVRLIRSQSCRNRNVVRGMRSNIPYGADKVLSSRTPSRHNPTQGDGGAMCDTRGPMRFEMGAIAAIRTSLQVEDDALARAMPACMPHLGESPQQDNNDEQQLAVPGQVLQILKNTHD